MNEVPRLFVSYAHHDDKESGGFITAFCDALEAEVQTAWGKPIKIWVDKKSLGWGDNWLERIHASLGDTDYFVPFISASYLNREGCRRELQRFLEIEGELGRNDMILPIYFRRSYDWEDPDNAEMEEIAELVRVLMSRQIADLLALRDVEITSDVARREIRTLADELTQRLRRDRATGGGSRPPPRMIHPLPTFVPSRVTGRDRVLAELTTALGRPGAALTALVGEAGIGKTAVAVKLARRLARAREPEGIVAVEYLTARGHPALNAMSVLNGMAEAHPDATARAALRALVRDPDLGVLAKLDAVLGRLERRRVLIVLDDLEQLLDDDGRLRDETLRTLLDDLPGRDRHGVRVLFVSTLPPRSPAAVPVAMADGLTSDELREFLSGLTPAGETGLLAMSSHQWDLFEGATQTWPRPAERIHGVTAGRVVPLQGVLDDIRRGRTLGEITAATLGPADLEVLRALAIYGRPVAAAAVSALVAEEDRAHVGRCLARLVDRRLVRRESGESSEERFALPPSERTDFLSEHGPATTDLHRRAASYLHQLAQEREAHRRPRSLVDVEPYLDAIELYLDCGDHTSALRLMEDVDDEYLTGWGQTAVLTVHLRRVLAMLTEVHDRVRAESMLGRALAQAGRLADAAQAIIRAAELNGLADNETQLVLLNQLGSVRRAQGLVGSAVEAFWEAVDLAEDGRELWSRADAYLNVALCLTSLGKFDAATLAIGQARRDLAEGSRVAASTGTDDAVNARLAEKLTLAEAGIALETGDYPAAVSLSKRAGAAARRLGAQVLAGRCDDIRAWALLFDNDPGGAMAASAAAGHVVATTNHPELARLNGTTRAVLHLQRLDLEEAAVAADLAVRSSHSRPGAMAYAVRGIVEWRRGRSRRAEEDFKNALWTARAPDASDEEPDLYDALDVSALARAGLALVRNSADDEEAALATYRSAIDRVPSAGVAQRRRLLFRELVYGDRDALPRLRELLHVTAIPRPEP